MVSNIYTLDAALEYENSALVHYFATVESMSLLESAELFVDLKKWLWLCSRLDEHSTTVYLFEEQRLIDSYWHCFLLFTRDYIFFCEKFLGGIVCHLPDVNMQRAARHNTPGQLKLEMKGNLGRLRHSMEEVGRVLGHATMLRWYRDIPNWIREAKA
ncbi:hypothetical protein [Pseudomonas costantinii]|uniref:hypothetical protein n=1 Tax=Pseudomonas costantinii TaxID=168469 RepID=UPI0015A27935|nr:hypothetical protein [Pseudomonas costantinii]NVZ68942.1 hypothetical protein [Pseudomonas costantinii]